MHRIASYISSNKSFFTHAYSKWFAKTIPPSISSAYVNVIYGWLMKIEHGFGNADGESEVLISIYTLTHTHCVASISKLITFDAMFINFQSF